MYKIYINETPLFLIPDELAQEFVEKKGQHLIARYAGKAKFLLNYIDMLEKSSNFDSVVIYATDLEQLFADFVGHFKVIDAAGGLVFNEENEILLIHRRSFWDLPKGKVDRGEEIPAAAIREVEEETGVSRIEMGDFIQRTYHTYRGKNNQRILKQTHWYRMNAPKQPLVPQAEEDIEVAEWMSATDFFNENRQVYGNIRDLLMLFSPTFNSGS